MLGIYDPNQGTEFPRAFVMKSLAAEGLENAVLEKDICNGLSVELCHISD